jgi:group II intron reverse transcriptase/maturase
MRNPINVLNSLESKASVKGYKFERLYRNLYNPEFFLVAYQNLYSREGNMTPGSDGKTIDDMSLARIEKLVNQLKDYSYQPNPSRRVYIEKKNGKKRPLGIPSVDDKLVQEVVRMILEQIYEDYFSKNSHGFRPDRSCHTALKQVQLTFTGAKWFVEGDIKGFFDNIDHHVLIGLLRKRIHDEHFVGLIWKFLKAGYLEDWTYNNTYSGTPQGGIVSPLLANIYLHELDKFMEEYKIGFDKGKRRQRNPQYRILEVQLGNLNRKCKKGWETMTEAEKVEALKALKNIRNRKLQIPYTEQMDGEYKRIQYVRYADDFLIGVIGSKDDALKVKEEIKTFLNNQLKLELSDEKTLITHAQDKARFLGYNVTLSKSNHAAKKSNGVLARDFTERVKLYVPKEAWLKKLLDIRVLRITVDPCTKKELWKPLHRSILVDNDDLEILSQYNWEIRGLYNYYQLANNASVLNHFKFIMEYSMYRTFAKKYKSTVGRIKGKYGINGKFGVKYETKRGPKIMMLYDDGFRRQQHVSTPDVDTLPRTAIYSSSTSLIQRLKARKCEWCGIEEVEMRMHHVRKLKDLKGKKKWEAFMISRKRKTMALCTKCHVDLHAGRLD